MARTAGARLATLSAAIAAAAMLAFALLWLMAKPLVELQTRRVIDGEARGLAALHAQVAPRDFGATVAGRSAVDAERGADYSLKAPNGVIVAGALDARAWDAPEHDGWREFDLPDSADPRGRPRSMLGRVVALADGSQLLIAYDLGRRMQFGGLLLSAALGGVLLAALLTGLAAWSLARRTSRQMEDVSVAMARILAGDLSQRLPVTGHTGVDLLTQDFNGALERIERLTTTMRAVADSTAHDLRAPLNRLRAAVEVALRREDDPAELRGALDTVLGEVDRVQNTLEALLRIALAESGTAPFEPVDLTSVVGDVEELYKPLAEEKGLHFETHIDDGLELPGNRQLLAQAVANLIDNAIKFTPNGGAVRLAALRLPDAILLEVADTGPGIPVEHRSLALERSRRLANASGTPGSGLGLSLVNAVARLHDGRFELGDNAPGLVARLRFSCAAAGAS